MKKYIFILISIFLLSGCATTSHLPFAPKEKHGKHETKKNKPVKKHGVINFYNFVK